MSKINIMTAIDWLVEQMLVNNYINKKQEENCKSWLIDEAKQLEKEQTDDFAVEFAEWYLNMWHRDDDSSFDDNSPKELLEIFKKEKYE